MRRALLLACCSCSQLFGLEEPTLDRDAASGDDAQTGCTRDDFEDGVIDEELWFVDAESSVVVNEADGALTISLVPSNSAFGRVEWRDRFDFASTSVEVEVVDTPSQVGAAEMYASARFDTDNALIMSTGTGDLRLLTYVNGSFLTAQVPWNAADHRFWRIGYDGALGEAVYSTSRDGLSWAIQHRQAFTLPGTMFTADLVALTTSTASSPGTAKFGSFVLRTADCPP